MEPGAAPGAHRRGACAITANPASVAAGQAHEPERPFA
jgi:hypothetical protein